MARMTPHALSTTAPARTTINRPSDNRNDVQRRIARIRREERWADDRATSYVRSTMHGRYGVRL
jgi:hypothetical protein